MLNTHLQAGRKYHQQGNWAAARSCYLLALHAEPVEARYLLGELAYAQSQTAEALRYLEAALERAPEHPDALLLLGNIAIESQDYIQAETLIQRALAARPEFHGAQLSLAAALRGQKKYGDALRAYQHFSRYYPDDPRGWRGQLYLWQELNQMMRQIQCLERLNHLTPWAPELTDHFIGKLPYCGQLENARKLLSLVESRPRAWWLTLSAAQRRGYQQHSHIWQNHRLYLDYISPQVKDPLLLRQLPEPAPRRRAKHYLPEQNQARLLKIAYLSREFGQFSTMRLLEPLLQHHSPELQLYAYDTGSPESAERKRLLRYFKQSRRLKGDPQDMAQTLRADGIQILVDMGGLISPRHQKIMALQAAPVQITGPGFLFSSGHAFSQYGFGDRWLCPPEYAQAFPEEICYLDTALHLSAPPEHPINPGPWSSQGAHTLVLGSASNPLKLNQEVLRLWIRMLKALPHSQLYLKSAYFDDPELKKLYQEIFLAHQIPRSRLRIEGAREDGAQAHLERFYHAVDIALDPFPYQGGITTVDALWMGVPVVVLNNPDWRARALSVSIYLHLGLQDWLVQDENHYLQRVQEWAQNKAFLIAQRHKLRARLKASGLFNGPAYATQIEAYYHKVWAAYQQQPP